MLFFVDLVFKMEIIRVIALRNFKLPAIVIVEAKERLKNRGFVLIILGKTKIYKFRNKVGMNLSKLLDGCLNGFL
jgi:hypothetical protein